MNGSRSLPFTPRDLRPANERARSSTLRWSSTWSSSTFSEISDFNEELAMIHLRSRIVAAGHRNWDLTCSRAGSFSFFLVQVNYAPAPEEVKAAQQGFPSEDWRLTTLRAGGARGTEVRKGVRSVE